MFKVLDCDGKLVGSGPTVEEAIAEAAKKLGSLPWESHPDAPTAVEVVKSFLDNGEFELELPSS